MARWQGRLRDYRPRSVREYLAGVQRRTVVAERHRVRGKLTEARSEARRLRRVLTFATVEQSVRQGYRIEEMGFSIGS